MMPDFDPVRVPTLDQLFSSIPEEMGAALRRAAYSPNIKDRLDFSCAVFTRSGRLLAQAAHIPVHLGAMPLMMDALMGAVDWPPGVMYLCNDPRFGGTHLPDITCIAPAFSGPTLVGFVASRAHHADVGGAAPGSMAMARELFAEGLILPPVEVVRSGRLVAQTVDLVAANSRTPRERRGDLLAQVDANRIGIARLAELATTLGYAEYERAAGEVIAYGAAMMRGVITGLPSGVSDAIDYLDSDGCGAMDLPIAVTCTVDGPTIRFDFAGSAPQSAGPMNATEAVTRSACAYAVLCLAEGTVPVNAGSLGAIQVSVPVGSIVAGRYPAPVAAGNVETSQRIVDVVLQALAEVCPDRVPAQSQGTMNNVLIGGIDAGRMRAFTYYETIAGGAGGSPVARGADAIQVHMTNTMNTPAEVVEAHYPLRVEQAALRTGSGGAGAHPGGLGVVRTLRLLSESEVTLQTERRRHRPAGISGGQPGAAGANAVRVPGRAWRALPDKWRGVLPSGALLRVATPGGGGWGADG